MSLGRVLLWLLLWGVATAAWGQQWSPLKTDGVHDPRSPGIKEKQEPAEALSALAAKAPDPGIGNQVRWVRALDEGVINPRAALWADTKVNVLDLDIYLDIGGSLPVVRFPHRAHTLWLDCANCHDHVFKKEAGATRIAMLNILEGEQCGICHGAVAFPLTECYRCHSVPQKDFFELEARLKLKRVGPTRRVAK